MEEKRRSLVTDRINNINRSQESAGATPTSRDESAANVPRRKPPPPPRPEKRRSSAPPPLPEVKPRKQLPAVKGKSTPTVISTDSKEESTVTSNDPDCVEPEAEVDEEYVHMRAPGVLGHDDACIVTVTGFDKSSTEDVLRDHFQDVQRSGGGPVDLVSIIDGTAAICFNNSQDAQRVLETRQELGGGALRLCPFSESVINHGFVISGKSADTSEEDLKDFLETKTEHLIECTSSLSTDSVVVLFMRQTCPDLTQLQTILKSSSLDKRTLTAAQYFMMSNDYDEPVQEHSIYATEEKIRFFKNYKMKDLQAKMKKKGIELTVDTENFRIKLSRKSGDFQEASPCIEGLMKDLHVNQYNILMPGVYTFLRSEEGQGVVSGLEKEETCTVFVEEDIYEDVEYKEDTSGGSVGDDSNPSAGSCQSDEVPETGIKEQTHQEVVIKPVCEYGLVQRTDTMGRFQVGKCQFLVKEGNVEKEEVECAVNITRSDIEQVEEWKKKRGTSKATLSRTLALKGADWSKKGFIASEVSGLPCSYSILVSLKHSGGNVAKAIKRCIKIADILKVTSMAFFYKGIDETREQMLQPFLKDYVESVYKYQRTESPCVTDIRLVVDRMAEEYIPGVQLGIESLLDVKRKSGIWHHLIRKVRLKSSSSQLTPGTGFQTYIPIDSLNEETSPEPVKKDDGADTKATELTHDSEDDEVDDLDKNGQPEYLYSSEAVICVCSNSEATNNRVYQKLEEHCHQHIQPRTIRDHKIQKLTRKQVKGLLRRAGRKVELHVNKEDGLIELRGYSLEAQHVYDKCKMTIDAISDDKPDTGSPLNPAKSEPTTLQDDTPEAATSKEVPSTEATTSKEVPSTEAVTKSERNLTVLYSRTTETNVPREQSDAKETSPPAASSIVSKQEDEFDVFGKHVAYEVRGITDFEKRTKLKRDIQKLIFIAQE